MVKLNFSNYSFRFKNSENKTYIFDIIRKKFLLLTPEEWVRQHVLNYLIEDLKYPKSLINVEKLVNVNGLKRRYDIVVFKSDGSLFLLVECKAPEIQISQATFDQIAQYNFVLKAENLMITNGLNHYFCRMDFENEQYVFLKELPEFSK